MPRSNEPVKKKVSDITADPMTVYREVSDWKGKCNKLVEALRDIEHQTAGKLCNTANRTAKQALKEFEENK